MKSCFQTLADRVRAFEAVDLYPVISSEFTNGRPVLEILRGVAAGGARIVQLREKNLALGAFYELATAARAIANEHRMLLLIDDHLDIALLSGADGVHLGQEDLPLRPVLESAPELLIGSSTHNLTEALAAETAGVGYLNIGPIYPTRTKSVPCGAVGLEMLQEVSRRIHTPFSVMGGIKERHLPELLAAGARHIAMVTEITQAPDVAARTSELRRYFHA
ncbi:thiamine phosphate synthase [Victivallis sp. Marseille-Q1083]|uniref:thiamine phosphate synthase n=1 Tax=Victivallis sp. Marseille-Q1083 TaxID=2717288 RepID=UPI00158C33EF|nr:thiamine phosphate synthase [Victivallis sp. Marseille-Q1083]